MTWRVVTDDPRASKPLELKRDFPTSEAATNWTKRPASKLMQMRVERTPA